MKIVKLVEGRLDPAHENIILAESLVNEKGDFYDFTFKQAIDEIVRDEQLIDCRYEVELHKSLEECKLLSFVGWTASKLILLNRGIFVHDSLLDYVVRNPPVLDRFTI